MTDTPTPGANERKPCPNGHTYLSFEESMYPNLTKSVGMLFCQECSFMAHIEDWNARPEPESLASDAPEGMKLPVEYSQGYILDASGEWWADCRKFVTKSNEDHGRFIAKAINVYAPPSATGDLCDFSADPSDFDLSFPPNPSPATGDFNELVVDILANDPDGIPAYLQAALDDGTREIIIDACRSIVNSVSSSTLNPSGDLLERAKVFANERVDMRFYDVMVGFAEQEIERVENRWDTERCDKCNYYRSPVGPCKCGQVAVKGSYEHLRARLSAQAEQQRWIPVSERLPENDEPVLTSTDTAYNHERRMYSVIIQSFCEGEWETQDVTHWQLLPRPVDAAPASLVGKEGSDAD